MARTTSGRSYTTRLSFEDFRPLKKGEGGYSPTARSYVSPSTGVVITKYEFQKLAIRTTIIPKTQQSKNVSEKPTGTRLYKGEQLFGTISHQTRLERYNRAVDGYMRTVNEKNKEFGFSPLSRYDVIHSKEFQMYYKWFKDTKDRKIGGKRHQALIYFGYLEENDDYY